MVEYTIRTEGGKRYLVINYKGRPIGPSVVDYPQCMKEVIELLEKTDADYVVLSDVYEITYDEEQTKMLKEIADVAKLFFKQGVWNPSKLVNNKACEDMIPSRYNTVLSIAQGLLKQDPIKAYVTLINVIKREESSLETLRSPRRECTEHYLRTLYAMRDELEKTTLIKKFVELASKTGIKKITREVYRPFFEAQIKPAFVSSRVFFYTPPEVVLVDQYQVADATVSIYQHPERINLLYYLNPPEYSLTPEKYFLLSKTREIVSTYHPKGIRFMSPREVKEYFTSVYETTIRDLADRHKITITPEEIEQLARIVTRYTVGYGMMELLLSDRKLTDVYMDAPLGTKPVYVVHGEYGTCETNVLFTEEEAKGIISRFRAQSGRPFDEAHPVLDYDIPDLQTRVAVIGPPLSPDGVAFALRLHKLTPWTLPQFIDVKMLNADTAGLLSFLIEAQASTLVNGSRGSGKTSLLMSLMLELLPSLRIIVQEDTLEIPVPYMKRIGYNIQRLKTQSAIAVSRTSAEVPPEEALRTALRLGDSVLVIGEVRSNEAKVLYEAMRVGAIGNVVMGTIHGENAYSVWDRIVNDLGVPNTSFKATDVIVTAAPIRFGGSLKRHRRVIEITEVKKHWYEDPEKEGGLLTLLKFDAKRDTQYYVKEAFEESELLKRIEERWGVDREFLMNEIRARAQAKQFLVDQKRKHNIPDLLEGEYTVPANNMYRIIQERQRTELGSVDHKKLLQEWKKWVLEAQVKPLIRVSKSAEKKKA